MEMRSTVKNPAASDENLISTFLDMKGAHQASAQENTIKLNFLQRRCYPILITSALLTIVIGFYFDLGFGLFNVIFLLWVILYLAACERIIPYENEWHPTLERWGRDGIYVFITTSGRALSVAAIGGRRLLAQVPILIPGVSQSALFIVSIFNTTQGYFSHANVNARLGRLNYLVGSPEQYRLHHSVNIQEAVGIKNPALFPPPNAIFEHLLHQFGRRKYSSTIEPP